MSRYQRTHYPGPDVACDTARLVLHPEETPEAEAVIAEVLDSTLAHLRRLGLIQDGYVAMEGRNVLLYTTPEDAGADAVARQGEG